MSDDERTARWLAAGTDLLRRAGAADGPAVAGGRLYQFAVDPAFVDPCVLAFDDRIVAVDLSLTIVGPTGVDFADVAPVPTGDVPTVRGWSAALIGRPPAGHATDWRDGVVCFVRIVGPAGPLVWAWVDNPSAEHHPAYAAVLAEVAAVAGRAFPREPVRSYLALALGSAKSSGGRVEPRRSEGQRKES